MKILMIWHFLPYPPHGGAAQRNFNLLRQIAKNHTVHLVTFYQQKLKQSEAEIQEGQSLFRSFCKEVHLFRIPSEYSRLRWYGLLFFNLFSTKPYSDWKFRTAEMAVEIRRQIAMHRFDVVHVDTIALARYRDCLGDIPAIMHHHNIESTLMLRRAANEKNPFVKAYLYLQGRKLRRLEIRAAGDYQGNITVSELDKQELQTYCPGARVSVVPNGTDTEYFQPRPSETNCGMIYAGGMTWYPNRDAMIWFCQEIFPLIAAKAAQAEMKVIGRFPPAEVQAAAEREPGIKAMGWVDDIRDHVANAAVYVVPIRVGGGTRLKILDAMAMGKAIVSTTVGAEGIETTDGENILIADTPEQFAKNVLRLFSDDTLRRKLERNARRLAEERYAWQKIAVDLETCYRQVNEGANKG